MIISLNKFTCPHCLRENATLFSKAIFERPITQFIGIVFTCSSCDASMIVDMNDDESSDHIRTLAENRKNSAMFINEYNNVRFNLDDHSIGKCAYYPAPEETTAPDHLPDNIEKNLINAKKLFNLKFYNESGMSSRRVLDLATKFLLPEHKGQLNSRIKLLLEKNIITKKVLNWANIIKLGGNSANHDYDDFTEEEAIQILDFTEMFLMYAFSLPKMVEIKQNGNVNN